MGGDRGNVRRFSDHQREQRQCRRHVDDEAPEDRVGPERNGERHPPRPQFRDESNHAAGPRSGGPLGLILERRGAKMGAYLGADLVRQSRDRVLDRTQKPARGIELIEQRQDQAKNVVIA